VVSTASSNGKEHVKISGGDWIELPSWISHGQMKQIQRILKENRESEIEVQTKIVAFLGSEWSLKDSNGDPLPLTPAGIEQAKQTKINECFEACTRLVAAATPNA
jgi:hypothetical protein